jgi:hypothetical protein
MGSSLLDAILDWMQVNRLRLCSYERLVSSIPGVSTYDELATIVGNNPGIFRTANIKNVGPGLALVDGYQFPTLVEPVTVVDLSTGEISTAPAVDAPVPSDPPPVVPEVQLTPLESITQLLHRAANSDISDSALNYAKAAAAAAAAVNMLGLQR